MHVWLHLPRRAVTAHSSRQGRAPPSPSCDRRDSVTPPPVTSRGFCHGLHQQLLRLSRAMIELPIVATLTPERSVRALFAPYVIPMSLYLDAGFRRRNLQVHLLSRCAARRRGAADRSPNILDLLTTYRAFSTNRDRVQERKRSRILLPLKGGGPLRLISWQLRFLDPDVH